VKEFNSFAAFAAHLLTREALIAESIHNGLKIVATKIEETAKEEIGTYQAEVGPFPAWASLADSTKADRVAQGYAEDEPLLREGDLRESIHHDVAGLEAVIGSDSDIALYQELGTAHIPPRPFLGPAAIHNEKVMLEILGAATVVGIAGAEALPSDLGYDFKVK
jgi:phage gpG-like protein